MRTETYHRLNSFTGKCEDEHYACMQLWIRKGRDPVLREDCIAKVRALLKALDEELDYLKTLKPSPEATRRITRVREAKTLAQSDLTLLTSH